MIYRFTVLFIFSFISQIVCSQPLLSNDKQGLQLAKECVDHMNNYDWEKFDRSVKKLLPKYEKHPAYPLLLSMKIYNIGLLDLNAPDENEEYLELLNQIVTYSEAILDQNKNSYEGLFFALCGYGYRGQYYSLNGRSIKAISEGQKAYKYFKKGKVYKDDFYDFYFMSGLFKFYLVQYPESHPIVKPMMWFFEDGDKQEGLEELDFASQYGNFTKATALNYLAYLNIRYEANYDKALHYAELFARDYPQNDLGIITYTTALLLLKKYHHASSYIKQLSNKENQFVNSCALLLKGWYTYEHLGDKEKALKLLHNSLAMSKKNIIKTNTIRALTYYKIAQIYENQNKIDDAEDYYEKSLDMAPFAEVEAQFEIFEEKY